MLDAQQPLVGQQSRWAGGGGGIQAVSGGRVAFGHGGARPGAGRPKGGISDARRLLLAGLERGLARAADEQGLTQAGADQAERATAAIAAIAYDLIRAGRGDEVVKIYALSATKLPSDEAPRSPLAAALARLPGMCAEVESGTAPAQTPAARQPRLIESTACDGLPDAQKSAGPAIEGVSAARSSAPAVGSAPLGAAQDRHPAPSPGGNCGAAGLLPQAPLPLAVTAPAGAGRWGGCRPGRVPPTPPDPPKPPSHRVGGENFEKIQPEEMPHDAP